MQPLLASTTRLAATAPNRPNKIRNPMDKPDWASTMETRERDACIDAARHKQQPQGNGICIDCHEAVEQERRTAQRCISCQQDEDLRQKQRYGTRL
jgi:RNA polymerase-binding transcription factor DksA